MFRSPLQRAGRSFRMAPVGAGNIRPPLVAVVEIDSLFGFLKIDRSRHEQFRLRAGIILWIRRALSRCDELSCFDKPTELFVHHRVRIHPKAIDGNLMGRRFLRVMFVRTHQESATGNPDHVRMRRVTRSSDWICNVAHRTPSNINVSRRSQRKQRALGCWNGGIME